MRQNEGIYARGASDERLGRQGACGDTRALSNNLLPLL
jgi:hypothetical protein